MKNKVLRHSGIVRLVHWIVAVSGLLLSFSGIGFMPLYGRFFVNSLPGLHWSTDFGIQMRLHYVTAMIFTAAVFFHLVYHLRRAELAAWPKRGDLRESWQIVRALLKGGEEPPHGKFLAEQRLAYAAIGLVILTLIGSGWILSCKNAVTAILDPFFIQVVTLLHMATTFLFLALIAAHVAAFLLKANWPLLPSMITGRVSRDYARKRHPRWKDEG